MSLVRLRQLSLKDLLLFGLPCLALVAGGFWLAAKFVKPAPPSRIVISTGAEDGAYHAFARQYARVLARDGIALEVRASAGAVENLRRLQDPASEVEVAFVQGGLKAAHAGEDAPALVSLAAVAYEPLWVFARGRAPVDHLTQLHGKRLAIGPVGSGTRVLAAELLEANGLHEARHLLSDAGGQAAAEALLKGEVDAAFLVASDQSPLVRSLLARKDVQLVNFATAEAYVRRFPHLSRLVLPRGSISFVDDLPPRDIELVSPTARLIARDDAHPALLYLLLQAATETHRRAGLFQRAGEFPAPRPGEFELSPEAERYFRQGLPFLQRALPFWLANLVERLWVLLLPLVAVVLPLAKIVPPLYAWRWQSKFYRRYGELRALEDELDGVQDPQALRTMLARVEALEREARALGVPLQFSQSLFSFRRTTDTVARRIRERLGEG